MHDGEQELTEQEHSEMSVWENTAAVVLDMDGVVFIGGRLREGIAKLVAALARQGIGYRILTNTSASSSAEISTKLARMGLRVERGTITTSSDLAADFIRRHGGPDPTVFTLGGGHGLASALRERGVRQIALEELRVQDTASLAQQEPAPSYPLVLGWTRQYDYRLATKVLQLEQCISAVYSTGADRLYAGPSGNLPAIGWLSGSVSALLGRAPVNLGKPNRYALDHVLEKLGEPPSRAVVIGDSLSDIGMGNEAGCRTILLLGGATPRKDLDNLDKIRAPWLVIQELTELL
jgi:HAD superfamily hydrolase (TIGR01450 family)